jgi:hypothetical protein
VLRGWAGGGGCQEKSSGGEGCGQLRCGDYRFFVDSRLVRCRVKIMYCRNGTKTASVYRHLVGMCNAGGGPVHRKLVFIVMVLDGMMTNDELSFSKFSSYLLQLRRGGYIKSDGCGHWCLTDKPWTGDNVK